MPIGTLTPLSAQAFHSRNRPAILAQLFLAAPFLLASAAGMLGIIRLWGTPNWARQLIGCDLATWTHYVFIYILPAASAGRLQISNLLKPIYITTLILAQLPISLCSSFITWLRRAVLQKEFLEQCAPPIIILGHYRSGTFFYQLMVTDHTHAPVSRYQTWWPHTSC